MIAQAAPLSEPLWQRQDTETDAEWQAFLVYQRTRSIHSAASESGYPAAAVEYTAARWSWNARMLAWDRETQRVAWAANIEAAKAAVSESILARAAISRMANDIVQQELAKIQKRVAETPVAIYEKPNDLRHVAHLGALALQDIVDDAQSPADAQQTPADWSRLTPKQLERAAELREEMKALRRLASG